jgi:hypothetical protein
MHFFGYLMKGLSAGWELKKSVSFLGVGFKGGICA